MILSNIRISSMETDTMVSLLAEDGAPLLQTFAQIEMVTGGQPETSRPINLYKATKDGQDNLILEDTLGRTTIIPGAGSAVLSSCDVRYVAGFFKEEEFNFVEAVAEEDFQRSTTVLHPEGTNDKRLKQAITMLKEAHEGALLQDTKDRIMNVVEILATL